MANDDKTALATTELPTRKDYLRRTLEVVTVEKWGEVVTTAVAHAVAGDPQARKWVSDQLGMAQSQLTVHLHADFERGASRSVLTAGTVRTMTTEDLRLIADDLKAKRLTVAKDVTPKKDGGA